MEVEAENMKMRQTKTMKERLHTSPLSLQNKNPGGLDEENQSVAMKLSSSNWESIVRSKKTDTSLRKTNRVVG